MGDQQREPQEMSDNNLNLPAGFRFYPRDDEIITFYLKPKVQRSDFTCTIIGEVNINRTEPWELPDKAKIGEKEWYFFSQKECKYPTGTRTNRATIGGYWKATGKDKEIYTDTMGAARPSLIGMKKTLVFYKGRAPRGEKTDWVMHEFRLEGSDKLPCPTSSSTSTTMTESSAFEVEWVVCRVFDKTTGVKRSPAPSPYNLLMADGGVDQSDIPIPMPLQFPTLPDFTMDPAASYYSSIGMNSMPVPPMMPPMVGLGSLGLQMNNTLFGNSMAMAPPMSFYHQMDMGAVGAGSILATTESTPSSMLSQNGSGMSPYQTNVTDISPMVSPDPDSVATTGIGGI